MLITLVSKTIYIQLHLHTYTHTHTYTNERIKSDLGLGCCCCWCGFVFVVSFCSCSSRKKSCCCCCFSRRGRIKRAVFLLLYTLDCVALATLLLGVVVVIIGNKAVAVVCRQVRLIPLPPSSSSSSSFPFGFPPSFYYYILFQCVTVMLAFSARLRPKYASLAYDFELGRHNLNSNPINLSSIFSLSPLILFCFFFANFNII